MSSMRRNIHPVACKALSGRIFIFELQLCSSGQQHNPLCLVLIAPKSIRKSLPRGNYALYFESRPREQRTHPLFFLLLRLRVIDKQITLCGSSSGSSGSSYALQSTGDEGQPHERIALVAAGDTSSQRMLKSKSAVVFRRAKNKGGSHPVWGGTSIDENPKFRALFMPS